MANATRRDSPVLFWVTIGLVLLLPLPLGSVYQWSWALMAFVVGSLLAFWSTRVALGWQEAPVGFRGIWWLVLPFSPLCCGLPYRLGHGRRKAGIIRCGPRPPTRCRPTWRSRNT
ncbi:MAG: hypothetical protein IPK78_05275 [Rhodospirillales bacterium]|nr:hypothetical protein [Rhodospirillales bacterium]